MGLKSNVFPTYYASDLKLHITNDPDLFPLHKLPWPGPVLTPDGLEEHEIDRILDSQRCRQGWQFLVCWVGFRPEDNEWLTGHVLQDCEALDRWYEAGGDGPDS